MCGARVGLTCAFLVLSVALSAPAQWITCEGTEGSYRLPETVSCSQAFAPQSAARVFLEKALEASPSLTTGDLAAILEEEASRTCDQVPDRGTLGMLYGVGRWGCENGYSYRNLCDGFYLRREIQAEYEFAVVYDVVVSSSPWNVLAIDSDFRTLTRAATGDIRISVVLSLRPGSAVTAPDGYAEGLRLQTAGEAKTIMREIIAYCAAYKEERCLALRALAAELLHPGVPAGATPTPVSVVASADKHLTTVVPLGLSSDQALLLVVSGVVTDDRGQPIADAQVQIAGTTLFTPTAADGSYRVSFFGTGTALLARRMNLVLERAVVDVALKPAGDGSPLGGVAADGSSRLIFSVTSHGIRPESVTVAAPALGTFERATSTSPPITFDKEGNGTLIYAPPAVVPDEALTSTVDVGTGTATRTIAAAPVSIDVRYADLDGAPQTTTVWIKVCRPPALLVQSFLGGPATWTSFADFARGRRLDCYVVGEGATWGLGNASLTDWAKDLARSVSEAKTAYAAGGIKIAAVDVVAHSASGLVARTLVEGLEPHQDLHRLILVGTPNHGLAWLDQETGAAASRWLAAHPTAAAELREGSGFIRQLSPPGAGETSVRYVNVIGRRPRALSEPTAGSSTPQDDGIVNVASAHLDGVPEIRLDGVVHAPALPIGGVGLTESPLAWAKLIDLLVGEPPHAEADDFRIELRRGRQISSSGELVTGSWTAVAKFPIPLQGNVGLRTGERGYAALSVAQGGETWGTISLDAKTEVVLLASSPNLVRMEVVSGRARFRANGPDGGDFEVILSPSPRGTLWYTAQPEVRTVADQADYVVAREETSSVIALGGTVIVEYAKGVGFLPPRLVEPGTGIRARASGTVEEETLPTHAWWESGVWRETAPSFQFPVWVMGIMLAGLAAAVIYRLRVRKPAKERTSQSPPR